MKMKTQKYSVTMGVKVFKFIIRNLNIASTSKCKLILFVLARYAKRGKELEAKLNIFQFSTSSGSNMFRFRGANADHWSLIARFTDRSTDPQAESQRDPQLCGGGESRSRQTPEQAGGGHNWCFTDCSHRQNIFLHSIDTPELAWCGVRARAHQRWQIVVTIPTISVLILIPTEHCRWKRRKRRRRVKGGREGGELLQLYSRAGTRAHHRSYPSRCQLM